MYIDRFFVDHRIRAAAICFTGCVFFLANLDFATTGDTIYYANIIDTLRFDQLTAHQGFYVIGFGFKLLLAPLLGLQTDHVLAVMNAFFGAGALSVAYLLLRRYLQSERDALFAVLMLVLSHRFFVNSTSGEVYILQTFFIWSAWLLFEQRRFYFAGVAFGIALWITPLTIAYGLFFPIVAWLRGFGIRSLLRMSVPVLLIYLPFLAFFYEELLWGVRGVIEQDERRDIDLELAAMDIFVFQIKHYSFLNLLIIPAMFALRREKTLLLISLACAVPNILYVISQLRGEDHVFILTLDLFIVLWFMIGWRVLREHSLAPAAALLLAAHGVVFLIAQRPFIDDSHEYYGDEMRAIGNAVRETDNSILFMDWTRRMAFVYFNREQSAYPLERGEWYDMSFDIADIVKHKTVEPGDFAGYDAYFVLDSYEASPQARLFLGDGMLRDRYEIMSEKRRIERFLDVECRRYRPGLYPLFSCD